MDLPELGTPGKEAKTKAKTLIPWLEPPFECPECGIYCDAGVSYTPQLYEYTESWICSECEQAYYRERE